VGSGPASAYNIPANAPTRESRTHAPCCLGDTLWSVATTLRHYASYNPRQLNGEAKDYSVFKKFSAKKYCETGLGCDTPILVLGCFMI
jgi:hypothetical protein